MGLHTTTLEDLITGHNGKLHKVCKEGQFVVVEQMVNNQFKAFSINSNAQDVNEMTQFELNVRLLDSLVYSLWT